MIEVDFGAIERPWHAGGGMSEAPMIHPSAVVKKGRMGPWTVLGPNTHLLESDFRDYSYPRCE